MSDSHFNQSLAWFKRAAAVIPTGIYGHTSPASVLPGASPYFATKAKGCRYWDIDNQEYIDLLCAYGPIILGYNNEEVEEAAQRQAKDGNCFNHPGTVMVELAERLVSLVDFSSWAVFGKNGGDMTYWAMQVAREATGKKKILKVAGGYHGVQPWCTPGAGGWIEEDRAHIHEFPWNDLDAFEALVQKYPNEIAGVITTAFHHPIFDNSALPTPGFLPGIESICRKYGIILILDDVRSGFRLDLRGSHRYFRYTPDLICFSKALGNGHPISAALGTEALRRAAGRVFLTGSFWQSAVPMAAAMKCLEIIERDKVIPHLQTVGEKLRKGFEKLSERHQLPIIYSGTDAIPFFTFEGERNFLRSQAFCREMILRGVFLHPHHNWFLCAAHTDKDIDQVLEAADASFLSVKSQF